MIDLLNWGLRTGVVISGLIGLVLLLRRPFARYLGAEATFLLWSLPLLRLCLPDIKLAGKPQGVFIDYDRFLVIGGPEVSPQTAAPLTPTTEVITAQAQTFISPQFIMGAIVMVWLTGALVWLSYHLIQHVRYGRLLRHVSMDGPHDLNPLIVKALNLVGLKKTPTIKIAPKNIGPLVSGLINPIVVLPKEFEHDYDDEAKLFALVHEFSHIKRRDLWAAFAALCFRALHWYNPLVHYAARHFRADLEAACDAYSLSKFKGQDTAAYDYARALLVAEHSETPTARIPSLSLALHETANGGWS